MKQKQETQKRKSNRTLKQLNYFSIQHQLLGNSGEICVCFEIRFLSVINICRAEDCFNIKFHRAEGGCWRPFVPAISVKLASSSQAVQRWRVGDIDNITIQRWKHGHCHLLHTYFKCHFIHRRICWEARGQSLESGRKGKKGQHF